MAQRGFDCLDVRGSNQDFSFQVLGLPLITYIPSLMLTLGPSIYNHVHDLIDYERNIAKI